MQVGDIVVVKNDGLVPYHFQNVTAGALFKVLKLRGLGKITVGDQYHARIRTREKYFAVVDRESQSAILQFEGTDLCYRMGAIQRFHPELQNGADPCGRCSIKANDQTAFIPSNLTGPLSARNPEKLLQRKLAAV